MCELSEQVVVEPDGPLIGVQSEASEHELEVLLEQVCRSAPAVTGTSRFVIANTRMTAAPFSIQVGNDEDPGGLDPEDVVAVLVDEVLIDHLGELALDHVPAASRPSRVHP